MKKRSMGFTLVEIMIVVAIIGLLAAIAIPSFMRARTTSQMNACINNLRQIEAAKDQFALEQGRTNGWAWADDEAAFTALVDPTGGYIKAFPLCPASTTTVHDTTQSALDYNVNPMGSNAQCAIVGETHVLP